jgi:hypothetical protein
VLVDCLVDVGHVMLPLAILHQRHFLPCVGVCLQFVLDALGCFVVRVVVDYDESVVVVLLLQDGVEVEVVAEALVVPETRHNYAERQLLIAAYLVLLLIVGLLFFHQIQHLGILQGQKWRVLDQI